MLVKAGKNKAQTTLEYAVLIGVIVAALIVMQTYVKRGFQGKMRESADNMGEQFSPGNTHVYKHFNSPESTTNEVVLATGETTTTWTTDQRQEQKDDSIETVDRLADENW